MTDDPLQGAPKPGDVIYLDTQLFLSHGRDDFRGGKATVVRTWMDVSAGQPTPFIETAQDPGGYYNWTILVEKQAQLAAEFGDRWAHPDPDNRPQFNDDGGVSTPAAAPSEPARAPFITRSALLLLVLAAVVVFALDRWTKLLVIHAFLPGESRLVIPHLLWWTYVQNTHGAFGLFGNSPGLLIVLAVIVLGMFAYAFRDAVQRSRVVAVAFGMIVGGAIGNIVDRFQHRWVVDFIDFRTIWPNVFNVADACITTGVGLLVLVSLWRDRRRTD